ncbi:MAG TPA: hypothetical protein VID48_06820 [Solirubrobacteraceae bacterium]
MRFRLLVTVAALATCDYLLWNWSLAANHTVMALVSGLTLPLLSVVFAWLLLLTAARVILYSVRKPRRGSGAQARPERTPARGAGAMSSPGQASASSAASSSEKLAA